MKGKGLFRMKKMKKFLACGTALLMLSVGTLGSAAASADAGAYLGESFVEDAAAYDEEYTVAEADSAISEEMTEEYTEPSYEEEASYDESGEGDDSYEGGEETGEGSYEEGGEEYTEDTGEEGYNEAGDVNADDIFDEGGDSSNEAESSAEADSVPEVESHPEETTPSVPDETMSSTVSLPFDMTMSMVEPLVGAGEIPLQYGVLSGDSLSTVRSKLSSVYEYGIVTKTFVNNSNQRTNFAAASYNKESGEHTFTPDLAGAREIPFISRSTGKTFTIASGIPAPANVHMQGAHSANVVSEDTSSSKVNKFFDSGDDLTAALTTLLQNGVDASKAIQTVTDDEKGHIIGTLNATTADLQNYVVDTTTAEFGANDFIVIKADSLIPYMTGNHLTIRKHSGQTIAFNTEKTASVSIGSFTVIADGITYSSEASIDDGQNSALRSQIISRIIFNTRSIKTLTLGGTAGTFLAPSSDVSVTVAEASSGYLVANGTVTANGSWHFLNRSRSSVATIKVRKTADPDTTKIPSGKFTFTLTAMDGGPMPETTSMTNQIDGFVTFPSIEISDPDSLAGSSYIYQIKETASEAGEAWVMNETPIYAKVTIGESGGASVKYYTDAACTTGETAVGSIQNTYTKKVSPINVQLKAAKALSVKAGFSVENNPATFIFNLTPMDSSRAADADTQSITGYGNVTFKALTFEDAGEYVYEITEQNTGTTGYIYDESVFKATINVTEEEGKLKASVSYEKTDENGATSKASSIKFTNRYAPEPVTEEIKVTKTVSGSPEGSDTFKFILTRAANNAKVDEVTITGSGSATFKALGYGSPGTYTYRVTEEAGNAGYVYDTSVYTVRIVLTDNAGVLTKTVTYTKDNNSSYTSADFTNVFLKGRFTFYTVRSDSQNQGVKDAQFGIYGIRETDRSSSAYKSVANALSGGTVNYDNLSRIATYTSESNGRVVFENLTPNTFYVIRQESPAPKGYQISKNPIIIHTVYSNGRFGVTMTSSGSGTAIRDSSTGLCKWLEHRVKVVINKKKSNGELLAGAKLRLIDTTTGNPVEAWTSKSTSGHEIVVKLQTGRAYRVVETAAPRGFQKASDTTFTVEAHPVANEDYVQTINIVDQAAGGSNSNGGSGSNGSNGTTGRTGTNSGTSGTTGTTSGASSTASGTTSGSTTTRTDGSRTGDSSPIVLWASILIAAAAVIILLLVFGRKKKR